MNTPTRLHNEARPRCPHCGAFAAWNGIETQCNNPRCNNGIPAPGADGATRGPILCSRCKAEMPATYHPPVHMPGQEMLDLEETP